MRPLLKRSALLLTFLLGQQALLAQTVVPAGIIDSDTHWTLTESPYLVQGIVEVYHASVPRLTIDAGVEVRFAAGARLDVGRAISYENPAYSGELHALGTAVEPILFTADNGSVGGWQGLRFNTNADANGAVSTLGHCVIEKAVEGLECISTNQPQLLENLLVRNCSGGGLWLSQCSPGPELDQVSLQDNGEHGLNLYGSALPIFSGLSLTGNGDDRVRYTGVILEDQTLDLASFPLAVLFTGETAVYSEATPRLTLTAGSELTFAAGAQLVIGRNLSYEHNSFRGQLTAVGTALGPIRFTADSGTQGGWYGMIFTTSADMDGCSSQLAHCIIEDAQWGLEVSGSNQPAILSDLEIRDCSEDGLWLGQCVPGPELQSVTLTGNAGFGLTLSGNALPVHSNLVMTGNGEDRVQYTGVINQDVELDLAAFAPPVVFTGSTTVNSNAVPLLTITPGSELRFAPGASLTIGRETGYENNSFRGQLTAVGTAMDPIVFTADNGLAGGWYGVKFTTSADMAECSSQLAHCLIERAEWGLEIEASNQPALLQDVEIRECSDDGLWITQCVPGPQLQDVSLLDNGGFGLTLYGSALPVFSGLTITGNADNRLQYTGTILEDLTLDLASFTLPLIFTGATTVGSAAQPRLTLTAGSELRFAENASLYIARNVSYENNSFRGQLTAVGTSLDPIVLKADNEQAGGWYGMVVATSADMPGCTSDFAHLRIEQATWGLECQSTNQPALLDHVVIRDCSEDGLYLTQCVPGPALQHVTLEDNGGYGLTLAGSALPLHTDLVTSGNGQDRDSTRGTSSRTSPSTWRPRRWTFCSPVSPASIRTMSRD